MGAVYTITAGGHVLADEGSLALAAEYSRIAARARPGLQICVDNRAGERVAEYVIGSDGKMQAWVR